MKPRFLGSRTRKLEPFWPLEVNDPAARQLNDYVNLATEWEAKSGSPDFDTVPDQVLPVPY